MNLVLTTCANYERSALEPFVVSLRKHVIDAQLVVFTSNLGEETQKWLAEQGATLVPMQIGGWKRGVFNRYRKLTTKNPLRFLPTPLARRWAFDIVSIMSLRFLYYRLWLKECVSEVDKVFMTDSKDVVFQANPFGHLSSNEVQFFLENKAIGSKGDNNRLWLDEIYGYAESAFLDGKATSCAGTTLGRFEAVERYLFAMLGEIKRVRCVLNYGEDQAMHNMILRRENCDFQRRAVPNAEGAVLTVLGCPTEHYILGPDDLVRNNQGEVIPVLHTYDRFPGLVTAQRRRLGLNIN